MFKRFLSTPASTPRDVEHEISSLCRAAQIEALNLTRHMRQDIGLDCGCDIPLPRGLPARCL